MVNSKENIITNFYLKFMQACWCRNCAQRLSVQMMRLIQDKMLSIISLLKI